MIKSIVILLLLIIAASCSIEEKTVFNKDFSGESNISVDMTALIAEIDSSDVSEFYRNMEQDKLDSIAAIRNTDGSMGGKDLKMSMTFDSISNKMGISFEFKNLEEANILSKQALENNSEGPIDMVPYEWEKKDKILIIPGVNGGETGGGIGVTMFSIERTFPKNIASVNDDRITISADKKTLTFKASMQEMADNPLDKIVVTFE